MKVVGVKINGSNKTVYYNDNDLNLKINLTVIVNTDRGLQFGTVTEFSDDENFDKYEDVIRIASKKDYLQHLKNQDDEKKALDKCKELIVKNDLNMTVIDASYNFDKSQLLFRFVSDERVDFRQLAKELGAKLRTRIELRQIGVRDETKILGGIGSCGRPLCCHTHLSEFVPVSIKMAKEQNLSLNPTKISGVCGRLMCCLKHEEETYEELNKSLPNVGDFVNCTDGVRGEVHSVNVLRQLVKVIVEVNDEKEIREYRADQLRFKRRFKKEKMDVHDKELRELEKLEKQEKKSNLDDN